jgi:16S rRNA (adenine1518-N6/adenine1519-N6)-dimethyltransferase
VTGDAPSAASTELVDVVDDDGVVRRTATRAEIRAGNLLHRSVFIAVITSADELVVHQRADWKDVWPSVWDVCFGGVVDAGESFEAAAVRELAEEAGLVVAPGALADLGEGRFETDRVREIGRIYVTRSDGPFTFPDGEVQADDRVPLAELPAWLAQRTITPDSLELVVPRLPPPGAERP